MWAAPSKFDTYRLCEQRRFRRACASAQSRQNLRYSLIQAVSQEEPSDRKPDPSPLWMAGHAQLKFHLTECSKTQIRLTRHMLTITLKGLQQPAEYIIAIEQNGFRAERSTAEQIRMNKNWCHVRMSFFLSLSHLFFIIFTLCTKIYIRVYNTFLNTYHSTFTQVLYKSFYICYNNC